MPPFITLKLDSGKSIDLIVDGYYEEGYPDSDSGPGEPAGFMIENVTDTNGNAVAFTENEQLKLIELCQDY